MEVGGRHNATVYGGSKLGVIKSTATGIEMDIDGFGRRPEPAGVLSSRPSGALPLWLQDLPPDRADMTLTDLNRLSQLTKHQDMSNELQNVFSDNPQSTTSPSL